MNQGQDLSYLWEENELPQIQHDQDAEKIKKKYEQGDYARDIKKCSCGVLIFSAGRFGIRHWYDYEFGCKFIDHVCKK